MTLSGTSILTDYSSTGNAFQYEYTACWYQAKVAIATAIGVSQRDCILPQNQTQNQNRVNVVFTQYEEFVNLSIFN